MAEGGGLLNRYRVKSSIGGSNPHSPPVSLLSCSRTGEESDYSQISAEFHTNDFLGRCIHYSIATEGDHEIGQLVEQTIYIPQAPELLLPILEVVPLQLLAYHIAVRRGCDVDQPRNLAKSVTVE